MKGIEGIRTRFNEGKQIKTVLKIIGAVMVLRGLQLCFASLRPYWFVLRFGASNGHLSGNLHFATITLIFTLIAAGLVVGGLGLWREKHWSRKFSMVVLSSDFLIRFYGAVNSLTYFWRHPEQKQLYDQMTAQASNGTMNFTISMIPSYIHGLLALAIVIFLMSKPAREYFKTLNHKNFSTHVGR